MRESVLLLKLLALISRPLPQNTQHMKYLCFVCTAWLHILFYLPSAAQTPNAPNALSRGKVVEWKTGEPIGGALVKSLATGATAISGPDGVFEIMAPRDNLAQFSVVAFGYSSFNTGASGFSIGILENNLEGVGICSLVPAFADTSLIFELTPLPVQLNREVVVTAQKTRKTNFSLPRSVTVRDKASLLERPARSVPEVLFGETGVWLQKTNHGGGSLFVRGLTGQQTLLLLDGIRLNNATFRSGPNQYLNTIDPTSIERIEVLRGHASAEYGSDALGGAVNLLTPEIGSLPSGLHGQVQATGATQNMEKSLASQWHWVGKHGQTLLASGAYRDFGDLYGGKGIGRQSPSGYEQWSYQAKFAMPLNLGTALTLTGFWKDLQQNAVPLYHKVKLENFAYNQFDPQRHQMGYLRMAKDDLRPWWCQNAALTVSWQRQREGRQSQKNGSSKVVRELDEVRTWGAQWQSKMRLPSFSHWTAQNGIDVFWDEVRSQRNDQTGTDAPVTLRGLYPDGARMANFSAYSLHTLRWREWRLDAGLRWSSNRLQMEEMTLGAVDVSAHALVGNLGLNVPLFKRLRYFAQFSTAFRAPNVDDLGTLGIVDFRYEQPNANLRPEKGRSTETGFKYNSDRFAANITGYYSRLNGLIGRVRTADTIQGYPVYQKENIGKAYVTGIECDLEWRPIRYWAVFANAAYAYGQNQSAREPLRRIPPAFGRTALRFAPTEHFALRAETVFAGWQRRLAKADVDDNRIADDGTPGWAIANVYANYRYRALSFQLDAQNLTNRAYRTHGSGIDGLGRSLWLRVGIQL